MDWASFLTTLLDMGLRLLEKFDSARAAEFRRRVADDGAGVLLNQLNPGADSAGVDESATGDTGRDTGRVDEQR